MIRSLQIGRGLAAFAVVLFHLSYVGAMPDAGASSSASLTSLGYLGVDFFFVLSGFIILLAHRNDIGHTEKAYPYVIKRFVRVYPIYWIITAIALLGAAVTGGVKVAPTQFGDILSTVSLIHFTSFEPPLPPAWTLFHEILFYGFFLLLIVNRRLGIVAFVAWFIFILFNFNFTDRADWTFLNTVRSANNISFFLGFASCLIAYRLTQARGWLVAIGALAVLVVSWFATTHFGMTAMVRLGYNIGFAMLIAGAVALERHGKLPILPPLELLGNASYTLYLTHESLSSTAVKLLSATRMDALLGPDLLYATVLVATIAGAIVMYWYLERPLLKYLRQFFDVRRSRPASSDSSSPISKKVAHDESMS